MTDKQKLIKKLQEADLKELKPAERLGIFRQLVEQGGLRTFEPLLPLCLTLQGKPYTLVNHFPFSTLFRTDMPKGLVLKCGRQVSKSTSLASLGVMQSSCIDFFRTLYVTPLYEQIRRFSNNYVRPFVEQSPVKQLWVDSSTEKSVLQRSFRNKSVMIFSYAFLDADRVRGISADSINFDEVQDLDPDHIPVIREVMSHSEYALERYTGTPKSRNNLLEQLWQRSSQAEWFIPCYSCGKWNIPTLEYDLEGMIGPYHDDISEDIPATVCRKCRSPIFPRQGRWVHRYPDRRAKMAGYHVPQIIMPLHYARPDKWQELLGKQRGWGGMSQARFFNEVLGESVDAGQKLITETDLRQAARLGWDNNPDDPDRKIFEHLDNYEYRILGIDWGGGGEEGVSFTTLCLLGRTSAGKLHVLWGKKLVLSQEHLREAREILHWFSRFRCHAVAHDYSGAGTVRETILVQAGMDVSQIMAFRYVRTASSDLIAFKGPTAINHREHYSIDKPRSLLYTIQAIKLGMIHTFNYDFVNLDEPGLLHDWLALEEEKVESRSAGDIYTITRNPVFSDDFAHAMNFAAHACWYASDSYPDFAAAAEIARVSPRQILAMYGPDSPGTRWELDSDFFSRF